MSVVTEAIVIDEARRLGALHEYDVLDSPSEQCFNEIVSMAAKICGTPISLVSLVDADRQWFKARTGLAAQETPRDVSFCAHAIGETRDVFVVPDAADDVRFSHNDLVTGDPNIRFYAGVPLVTPEGQPLGTLCVIDHSPRSLDDEQLEALRVLSRQAMCLLEFRRERRLVAEQLATSAEASETLRIMRDRVDWLSRHISEVVWVVDTTADALEYVSASYDLVWGRPHAQLLGRRGQALLRAVHPADAVRLDAETVATGGCEYRITRPDGTVRNIAQRSVHLGDDGRRRVAVIATDVTSQRDTEQRLQETTRRLQAVFDATPLAVLLLDPVGRVLLGNETAEALFGWRVEDVIGRPNPTVPPDRSAEFAQLLARVLAGETFLGLELTRQRVDGTRLEVSMYAAPVRDPDGRVEGAVALFADVSGRHALERQLREMHKLEAVGLLAGGIAHDFNNILSAVINYAVVVRDDLGPGDPRRHDLDEVVNAATRGTRLVRQLLTFARRDVVRPESLDLGDLVVTMADMLRRLLGEDVRLEVEIADELPRVRLDRSQAEQVVLNLAVNARNAMPSGGSLTITLDEVTVVSPASDTNGLEPGRYVRLSVVDTGVGMPAEIAARAFEPFFTTRPEGEGTGLGLATLHGIVTESGGQVHLDSVPARGTTVSAMLPVSSGPQGAERPGPVPVTTSAAPRTILLVEDEPSVQRIMERILTRDGHTVLIASSGDEALGVVEQHHDRVDLLVTDVIMPGMTGQDLAQRLRGRQADLRVLFVSGYPREKFTDRGLISPHDRLLHKPFGADDLRQAVSESLRG